MLCVWSTGGCATAETFILQLFVWLYCLDPVCDMCLLQWVQTKGLIGCTPTSIVSQCLCHRFAVSDIGWCLIELGVHIQIEQAVCSYCDQTVLSVSFWVRTRAICIHNTFHNCACDIKLVICASPYSTYHFTTYQCPVLTEQPVLVSACQVLSLAKCMHA